MFRVKARSLDRKKNPKAEFSFYGKTKQAALSRAKQFFKRQRNVTAGFYDEDGEFHPIRASRDYSSVRAGEASPRQASGIRYHKAKPGESGRRKNARRRVRNHRRKSTGRRSSHGRDARATARRRKKNSMRPALARYWKTHRRSKNRRRK